MTTSFKRNETTASGKTINEILDHLSKYMSDNENYGPIEPFSLLKNINFTVSNSSCPIQSSLGADDAQLGTSTD